MRDSVAQPTGQEPPPNSSFEVAGRYPAPGAAPSYAPPSTITAGPNISPTRALLTNEPTSGYAESFMRGIPAQVGGAIGGVVGGGVTAGLASLPAAGIGAAGGEGIRQSVAQAYSAATGRPFSSPLQVAGNMGLQGALGVAGQGGAVAMDRVGKYVVRAATERLPATLKNFFGIAEPITEYTQKRGSANVFTPQNLNEGAALDNVGGATADLAARRSSVGAQIGVAEDAVLSRKGDMAPSVRHIREGLEKSLYGRGISDPKTAVLARNKEVGILNKLVDVLTPTDAPAPAVGGLGVTLDSASEKLTLRQALNAKRLIDENLEFAGKELSSSTEQLLKKVNHQIRESVRSEMGPTVSGLWDDFGKIADAQEKLAEFTGTRALSNVEQRAVQALRGIMQKNPGEVENIVKVLGAGLPGGEQQARTIFDSIAAAPFTKGGVGAPSNIILKTLTAGGLLSGPAARTMVRGSEAIANMNLNPAALSYGASAAGYSPIASEYMRRRFAQ